MRKSKRVNQELFLHNIIYHPYGKGPQFNEAVFSILSAQHHGWDSRECQITVYTDTPEPFKGLGVQVRVLSADTLREWAGPANFNWRQKICVMIEAIQEFGASTILLDGDTYFLVPPAKLLERVCPGRSLMHVHEGAIGDLHALGTLRGELPGRSFTLPNGTEYQISPATRSWNAGVVGVDIADATVLHEILDLTDTMQAQFPNRLSEQVSFGLVFERRTQLSGCRDLIFHYHQKFLRDGFRKRLPDAMPHLQRYPLPERRHRAYRHRPIPAFSKKLKASLKRAMKPYGCFRTDLETSI